MILNPFVFLIARTMAKNSGVSDGQATTDGFAASVIKPPVLGLVLVSALAKSQAQVPAPSPKPTPPAPEITGVSVTSPSGSLTVTLSGANFGATQGTVLVDGKVTTATITSWNDKIIIIDFSSTAAALRSVAAPTATGSSYRTIEVCVRVNSVDSNSVFIAVI